MARPLRLLIVEDSPDDTELVLLELRRGGFEPCWQRVETAEEMRAALAQGPWEVVLWDYTLPGFDAVAALALLRQTAEDLPFLVVSGTIGEEQAVQLMKAGAADYLLKGNLARLAPAVERTLREAEDRRARRAAEQDAYRMAAIVESSEDAIIGKTLDGTILSWNTGAERLYGYAPHEAIGRPITLIIPPDRQKEDHEIRARIARGERVEHFETVRVSKQGRRIDVSLTVSPIRDRAGRIVGASVVARDITERKRAEEALRRAHDEMEARVRERTAELARTNDALHAEVRERHRAEEARTELLRRLATAQEGERRRISRELHDQVGQQLTSLILTLKALRDGGHDLASEQGLLERLQKMAEEIGRELHDVALRLRPTALDDLGLSAALQSAVEEWSCRSGVEVDFHSSGLEGQRLPGEAETTLYRVVLEALHNILKHAGARHVSVILERRNNHAVTIVEDDGAGFEAEAMFNRPPPGWLGLLGMRERVALVGGTLEIESTPGAGTTVFARIPLSAEGEGGQP